MQMTANVPYIRIGATELPLDPEAVQRGGFHLASLPRPLCDDCGRDLLECATLRLHITAPAPVPHSVVCDCGREYPVEVGPSLVARLRAAPVTPDPELDRLRRKRDQAWELAGLARQDDDKADELRRTEEARELQRQISRRLNRCR
jgi:hypothetical protein